MCSEMFHILVTFCYFSIFEGIITLAPNIIISRNFVYLLSMIWAFRKTDQNSKLDFFRYVFLRNLHLNLINTFSFKIFQICGAISVNVDFSFKAEAKYYSFVVVTGIVIEFILIILNLFRIVEKLDQIPWNFGVTCISRLDSISTQIIK